MRSPAPAIHDAPVLPAHASAVARRHLLMFGLSAVALAALGLLLTVLQVAASIDRQSEAAERARLQSALDISAARAPLTEATALEIAVLVGLGSPQLLSADAPRDGAVAAVLPGVLGGTERVLSWVPEKPGTQSLRSFGPTRVPLVIGAILAVGYLLVRSHGLARALDIQKETARRLSLTDGLTGLGNRRSFDLALQAVGGDAALLVLDLDGFKTVNDRYGHPAGDVVLRSVARRLGHVAGPNAVLARTGGDEFAVLLIDGAGQDLVARLARRIIEVLSQPIMLSASTAATIGVSIGVAHRVEAVSPDEILIAADRALYEAKRRPGSAFVVAPGTSDAAQDRMVA